MAVSHVEYLQRIIPFAITQVSYYPVHQEQGKEWNKPLRATHKLYNVLIIFSL